VQRKKTLDHLASAVHLANVHERAREVRAPPVAGFVKQPGQRPRAPAAPIAGAIPAGRGAVTAAREGVRRREARRPGPRYDAQSLAHTAPGTCPARPRVSVTGPRAVGCFVLAPTCRLGRFPRLQTA
jgi:hypothetical protein